MYSLGHRLLWTAFPKHHTDLQALPIELRQTGTLDAIARDLEAIQTGRALTLRTLALAHFAKQYADPTTLITALAKRERALTLWAGCAIARHVLELIDSEDDKWNRNTALSIIETIEANLYKDYQPVAMPDMLESGEQISVWYVFDSLLMYARTRGTGKSAKIHARNIVGSAIQAEENFGLVALQDTEYDTARETILRVIQNSLPAIPECY